MSKRYGRNQKRAARAEIARLSELNERFTRDIVFLQGELVTQTNMLRDIVDMIEGVCYYSSLIPPKLIPAHDYTRLNVAHPHPKPSDARFETLNLHALKVWLEENSDTLRRYVHVTCMDKHVTYAASVETFKVLPERILVGELAGCLHKVLQEK